MSMTLTTHREIPQGDLLHEILTNLVPSNVDLVVDQPERTVLRSTFNLASSEGQLLTLVVDVVTVTGEAPRLLVRAGELG